MKKIMINNLYIEVTRNCTMQCNHCLRGEKQNINLSTNSIDELFDNKKINIIKIKNLTITGGEPTINSKTILHLLKKIISEKIIIEHFVMVTNGTIYNKTLVEGLNTFYNYYLNFYHYNPNFYLICSQDQFHERVNRDNLNKYSELPYFISNYINLLNHQILNIGRARENKIGYPPSFEYIMNLFNYSKNNNYPKIYNNSDQTVNVDELYMSSKGLYSFHIIDVPFEQIDELCIYDTNEMADYVIKESDQKSKIYTKQKNIIY